MFGAVVPLVRLRFEASGRGEPHGNTVMNPSSVASTPVTFRATAAALSGAREAPKPVTLTATVVPPAGMGPVQPDCPSPRRVSRTRSGCTATNAEFAVPGGVVPGPMTEIEMFPPGTLFVTLIV